LDGTYRVDFDQTHQTVNGNSTSGGTKQTHWWAFHSLCTPTRCIATGAGLSDNNQQEPSGTADVFQFIDGHWEDTPSLQDPDKCAEHYQGPGTPPGGDAADSSTIGWSLEPQPDGTLHGFSTTTVITEGCGKQGKAYKTPIVATRIGDVPLAVVLADPALFQS
jgi:serine/threonine-protein kinase